MIKIPYFAYGSNMNSDRMIARNAEFESIEKAHLKDYCLLFNKVSRSREGVGFANIAYRQNSTVEGVLYFLKPKALENLDKYEDYPVSYRREVVTVKTESLKTIEAQVYIANSGYVKDNLLPDKAYIKHLLKARELLSEGYYNQLLNHPTL